MTAADDELQQKVTRLVLGAVADAGFALAGAGAIRAHGLTDRPTEDVDLFSGPLIGEHNFRTAVDDGARALQEAGYEVTASRQFAMFVRLRVEDRDGHLLEVDFAINWRADPPVQMSVGPVLSERDAVAGKIEAVYTRGEVRDFLDLDAIRASGRYTDTDLLALGHEHDEGFDRQLFAAQLSQVTRIRPSRAAQYGITEGEFRAVQERTLARGVELRDEAT